MSKIRDASPVDNISDHPSPPELCKWCREFDKIPFQHLQSSPNDFPHLPSFQDIEIGAKTCQICIRIKNALQSDSKWNWIELCSASLTDGQDFTIYTRSTKSRTSTTILRDGSIGPGIEHVKLFVVFEWKNTVCEKYYGNMTVQPDYEKPSSEISRRAQQSRFTGSEEHFSLIRDWLYSCSGNHSFCTTRDQRLERPTRLLEIIDNGKSVRVVTKEQSNCEPYATLSYCWGPNPDLQTMLLRDNEERYANGVSVTSLNSVFQDAISVCLGTSVRYLWIDALCIVQGAGGDFKTEAQRMRDVYAGSLFTIVAASSSDPTKRFLVERDPRLWFSCKLSEGWLGRAKDFCQQRHNVPGHMIVDTRGWCFQKRCLSARSIYFTVEGIHWECREGIACEDYVQTSDHGHYRQPVFDFSKPVKVAYRDLLSFKVDLDNKSVPTDVHDLWWRMLSSYSRTKLSHHEDRLIAIAGIASLIMKNFNVSATCGLWKELFVHELLWRVCTGEYLKSRQDDCSAPSWSWASMPSCHIERCRTKFEENKDYGWRLIKSSSVTCTSLPPADDFGPLERHNATSVGSRNLVRIKGKLIPCQISKYDGDGGYNSIKRGASRRNYFPDTSQEEANLCCVLLRIEQCEIPWTLDEEYSKDGTTWCYARFGLVLAPMQDEEGVYRRTGVFEEVDYITKREDYFPSSPWDDLREEQEISIV